MRNIRDSVTRKPLAKNLPLTGGTKFRYQKITNRQYMIPIRWATFLPFTKYVASSPSSQLASGLSPQRPPPPGSQKWRRWNVMMRTETCRSSFFSELKCDLELNSCLICAWARALTHTHTHTHTYIPLTYLRSNPSLTWPCPQTHSGISQNRYIHACTPVHTYTTQINLS